jgi:hypothetical protein
VVPAGGGHAEEDTGVNVKAGDTVKLIGIPVNLLDYERLQTRTLFEKCLGKTFVVVSVDSFEGVPFQLAQLQVGHVIGEKPFVHSIWVEEEFLQIVNS